MWRRGAKKLVNANESFVVRLDACNRKIQSGGIRHPSDGRNNYACFSVIAPPVSGKKHVDASSALLKWFDDSEVLSDFDTRIAKRGGNRGRHLFVLGRQDARSRVEELDLWTEGVEDRSDLHASGSSADNDHRRGYRSKAPRISVGGGELAPRNWELPAHAACANDDLASLQHDPTLGYNGVWIDEAGGARIFMYDHSQRIDLPAKSWMRADVIDHFLHSCE